MVRLVAGTADSDIAPQLADLGIGYIWVTGADEATSRIDNTPGLGTASGNEQGTVWELSPAVSRRTVLADGATCAVGGTPASVPPGPADRQLRIGEAADPALAAELDGRRWPAVTAAGSRRSRCRRRIAGLVAGRSVSPAGCCWARAWCCWSRPCWPLPAYAVRRSATRPNRPGGPPPCRSWCDGGLSDRRRPPNRRRVLALVAAAGRSGADRRRRHGADAAADRPSGRPGSPWWAGPRRSAP